jgi:hypothetical protein
LGKVKKDGKKICIKENKKKWEKKEREINDEGVKKKKVEGKEREMVENVEE